jgi:Cu(I)/Ag(I) efflux system periplasmic protein CusF
MKTVNIMKTTLIALLSALSMASAVAQTALEMTEGEIRKVDANTQKITIKHGFIKNLDMPGMTMVFVAKDKTQLDGLATGDKVQFAVEMVNGKFTVIEIKKIAP